MGKKTTSKIGRPTKYKPEICGLFPKIMEEGESIEEVAVIIGVSVSTIYLWKEKHKKFSEALKKGVEISKAWWLKQGRIGIRENGFNSTLWYMNMKNRHGWADKNENKVDVTVAPEIIVKFTKGPDADNNAT